MRALTAANEGVTAVRCTAGRLLNNVGAGGLAVAMGLFGRSTPAEALINYQCCHLVYPPSDWNYCHTHGFYTWSCTTSGGFLWCQCCERSGGSAAHCQYG